MIKRKSNKLDERCPFQACKTNNLSRLLEKHFRLTFCQTVRQASGMWPLRTVKLVMKPTRRVLLRDLNDFAD